MTNFTSGANLALLCGGQGGGANAVDAMIDLHFHLHSRSGFVG
jgi:hypothetical protein